ncbi:MAG: AMP-binding protein [Thioalkalispiraceae bacterium]
MKIIKELVDELHVRKPRTFVLTLDSSIDDDLGLDSLARVELISRIEQSFNIALPQKVFADAESPRDLLRAIISAQGREETQVPIEVLKVQAGKVEKLPDSATTLIEMLEWHVEHHPERMHIRNLEDDGAETLLTYQQLWQGAQQVAAGLQQQGVQPGDTVAIMLPTGQEYFYSFFGVLLTGAIPVPIYPPVRRSQLEEHLRRHAGILNNCSAISLITFSEAKVVAQLLKSQVTSLRHIITVKDLKSDTGSYSRPIISSYDVAFLQYTSGSTGSPKGVVLTHANLLANIRAMGRTVHATPEDVFVSWLPLYHDMGLIGAWLGSMYFAILLVVMSPLTFLARPLRWFQAIHKYQGTLSASPNFGYELCLKRIAQEELEGLDLSSWRLAFNGAEPVSPDTIERFTTRFKSIGFRPETMMPVYGLAESSVGLAFPTPGQKPVIDCVQRDVFSKTGEAKPANPSDENALCFVTCGHALAGHQVRIVDTENRELRERHQGYLQFRGPSVTTGYYRNPELTSKLFKDDWLDSGDLAYIADGEIFITGREKDVIIRAGRNIYPHELEEVVGNLNGIRKGCVVAFGAREQRTATERLVILAETRETDAAIEEQLKKKIAGISYDLTGIPADEVILVPPHTVLKTSSGKVRRSACRDLYEQGLLRQAPRAVWLQIARTAVSSVLPVGRRLWQQMVEKLYAAYTLALFAMLASIAWLLIMSLPRLSWRWTVVHKLSRFLAFASRVKIVVKGIEHLPPTHQACIYVANHASYIDSLALLAVIPRQFSFIAKEALQENIFTALPLKKLQARFVERFDTQQSIMDIEGLAKEMHPEQSLFFFPEGTFTRVTGLRSFRMGAFMTAVQANRPIVPVSIRGTRAILRDRIWFPHRGQIVVTIGPVISPEVPGTRSREEIWRAAVKLRDASREHILRYCGEPDLSLEK